MIMYLQLFWWVEFKQWLHNNPYFTLVIVVYPALLLVWLTLLWMRPIWLLKINEALSRSLNLKLPAWLGGMTLPLRHAILVGFFHYHPRVLNAWVVNYVMTARKVFRKRTTVEDRAVHIPIPIVLNRESIPDLNANNLRSTFNSNLVCLLVWGEGGSGKTSLACLLAKWAMSEDKAQRLCQKQLMLPVLIEQDLEIQANDKEKPFLRVIRDQLRGLINEAEPLPTDLLRQLLKHRRILVIVDGFSEMSDPSRIEILAGVTDIPVNSLIVTSRTNESLSELPKSIMKPLRIKGNRLASFMEAYLSHLGKRESFDDEEFFDACRRLSSIVGDRDITALLAKLYADQIIRTKEGVSNEDLPGNIPELMLSYLNDINRGASAAEPDDSTVHRASEVIAWQCLKDTFRPVPASLESVLRALGGTEQGLPYVRYFEHKLKIIQTVGVDRERIRFSLDPLAEYLAGLYVINQSGGSDEFWSKFLLESDEKDGAPETIKGFLLAVRDCCLTRSKRIPVPVFVAEELAKRAGLVVEDKQKARNERRIKKLIRELRSIDADERSEAAKALGDLEGGAKLAVPALIEALSDKENSVCRSAVDALGSLGSVAQMAVPALSELLTNQDQDISSSAAFALGRITPETADIVIPALIQATRHPDEDVSRSARYALRHLGPEAKSALPVLIELLKHPVGYVRRNAAYVLGRIGPEAKAAIPSLIELFKDKGIRGENRSAAVLALERIGPVAIPELIEALKDKDTLLRLGAVYALARFGSGAAAATSALIEALEDPDEDVRVGASYALVTVPGERFKETIPRLIKLLANEDAFIRWAAAIALGSVGAEAKPAVPTLVHLLNDANEDVCASAAEALEKIGKGAVLALKRAADDESDEVRDSVRLIIDRIHSANER